MAAFAAILGVLCVAGGVAVTVSWVEGRKRRAFALAMGATGALEPEEAGSAGGAVVLTTKPPARPATFVATMHRRGDPGRFDTFAKLPALGARTTLRVTAEGVVGALREKLGGHDIHTGDAALDALLCLRGADPDVVRALFRDPAVKDAATALFTRMSVREVAVDADGEVKVRVERRGLGLDPHEAHGALAASLALVDALDRASSVRALPEPLEADLPGAVGGSSGAPVGVVTAGRRRSLP